MESSDYLVLKRRRAALRGHTTRILKEADTIVNSGTTEKPDVDRLKRRLPVLAEKIDELKTITAEMLNIIPLDADDDYMKVSDEAEEHNCQVNDRKGVYEQYIHEHSKPETKFNPEARPFYPSEMKRPVNLPKLTLPSFGGEILSWSSFWDSFRAVVHDVPQSTMPIISKFQYLKSLLKGPALLCISGLNLTEANYSAAIDLLTLRFGQTHKIVDAHLQALVNLPAPKNSTQSLVVFRDNLEAHIRSLSALKDDQLQYGDMLVSVIVNKLPSDVRTNLARKHGTRNYTLDEIRLFLQTEIDIQQAGGVSQLDSISEATVSTFVTNIHSNTASKTRSSTFKGKSCVFCNSSNHYSTECTRVPDIDQRIALVREQQLCFNCLGRAHKISDCKSRFVCKLCQRKHHTSLCNDKASNSKEKYDKPRPKNTTNVGDKFTSLHCSIGGESSGKKQPSSVQNVPVCFSRSQMNNVLPKTAVACVCSNSISLNANVLLDDGSQRSFITEEFASKLELKPIGQERVNISSFASKDTLTRVLDTVQLDLKADNCTVPLTLLVVPQIATPLNFSMKEKLCSYPHLSGLNLAHPIDSDSKFVIDILIGADQYYEIVEDKIIRGDYGPLAVKSKLGYLLAGPTAATLQSSSVSMFNIMAEHRFEDSMLEKFWDLESLGIRDKTDLTDMDILKSYCESIHLTDRGYIAPLPWLENHPVLPANFEIVKRRTLSTIRRFAKDPTLLQKYGALLREQENRKFIQKIATSIVPPSQGTCHYLPHHPVFKQSATTPLRIVFDCSFHSSSVSPSLNDCLMSGPSLQNDISEIFLRFRQYGFAAVSDIEKAFLHIGLCEEDKDFTRFFWLSDPLDPASQLNEYRFNVVLFGATSSPFILNATIFKHLESHTVERDLLPCIYVDNFVKSCSTEKDLTDFYSVTREILLKGNFNVRSWSSNNDRLKTLAECDRVFNNSRVVPVLGLIWNTQTDRLSFNTFKFNSDHLISKREILRDASTIFDPLGIVSPVAMCAKLFMQKLWSLKLCWDEPVSDNLRLEWLQISSSLKQVDQISFERSPNSDCSDNCLRELHVFADSSMKAYGAAAYLQCCKGHKPHLLIAKGRVAPLKTLTIPQLELTAALIASRLAKHIKHCLTFQHAFQTHFWTDSQIVLSWIRSDKKLPVFAANRVKEIKLNSEVSEWQHCASVNNPADILSRSCSATELVSYDMWWHGPQFLMNSEEMPTIDTEHVLLESNAVDDELTNGASVQAVVSNICLLTDSNSLIEIQRFSSYVRLQRVMAYILRFVQKSKRASRQSGPLTLQELQLADKRLVQLCQAECFSDVYHCLKQKKTPVPSIVNQLRLFMDESNTIRSGGRIGNADLTDSVKYPILLPTKHHLVLLLIRQAHHLTKHSGVNQTVVFIRQTFWIPKLRQRVKTVLKTCVTCKKVIGRPYSVPRSPHLPSIGVRDVDPFQIVGIDFTGSLNISDQDQKAYICLFTCAVTRAVHLEVTTDLSVDSFLHAFRRFVSRRGLPLKILSDNASTFESASKELFQIFKTPELVRILNVKGVEWLFIPKRAPWFGGFWERLIGLTKIVLRKVLGRARLTYNQLVTVVTEAEACVNDRPLTYLSADSRDPDPVTPSKLVCGRIITQFPHHRPEVELNDSTYIPFDQQHVENRFNVVTQIVQRFWKQWQNEYVLSLRERYLSDKERENQVKLGDVVHIHNDGPRVKWKLGIITRLHYDKDGLVRSVALKTSTGYTTRPIARLFPLEVDSDGFSDTSIDPVQSPSSVRPQRLAASRAREKILEQISCSLTDSDSD